MSGVEFPVDAKGGRSTTDPAKDIWARAFASVDEQLVGELRAEKRWRQKYADHLVPLTEKSAATPEMTLQVAKDGLEAVHDTFDFVRDGKSVKLADAMRDIKDVPLSGVVKSDGTAQCDVEAALALPLDGETYTGDALVRKVQAMLEAGQTEPDVVAAVEQVLANAPSWRDALADTYFVLLGATSELCPLEKLLELGLNVVAIARPNAARQGRLVELCERAPAGATLTLPVLKPVENESMLADKTYLASVSGADILTQTPEVRNWLLSLYPGKRMVIGSYIYLDGRDHVRASVAMDAVLASVIRERPGTSLMYLGTPAVVYPVPKTAYDDSRKRLEEVPFWHKVAAPVLGPFIPNYGPPLQVERVNPASADQSKELYMLNGISNVQGPNYMLAKTLQNWRAMVARDVDGCRVSVNMAPVCMTDSVMHVATVARAVKGMKAFPPLTAYKPDSAKALMALLLIFDMCADDAATDASPAFPLRNPLELFAAKGMHGGLWRCPYTSESTGKTAYVLSLIGAV